MTTTDEALRVAMQSALTWMENHGEVVLDGGGWAAIDSMNKCAADLRSALRTIALAVEAPSNAVQSVALGEPNNGTFADKSGTFADTAGTFASASGAVGETAGTREQIMEQAARWHDENTIGGPDCEHRQLEMLAYVEGYSAALAAALPGTSNGQENGK